MVAGEPLLASWTQTFMSNAAGFVAQFFPIFLLGALFGKLMEASGSVEAIAADLADLRKFIGPAREQAQRAGNFDLADNLGRLGNAINQTIEGAPGYAEANANYQQFA